MTRNYTNSRAQWPKYNGNHGRSRYTIRKTRCNGSITAMYVVCTPGGAYGWRCASRMEAVKLAGLKMVHDVFYPVQRYERYTSIRNFVGYPWTCQ
jgi:hypothetical protein